MKPRFFAAALNHTPHGMPPRHQGRGEAGWRTPHRAESKPCRVSARVVPVLVGVCERLLLHWRAAVLWMAFCQSADRALVTSVSRFESHRATAMLCLRKRGDTRHRCSSCCHRRARRASAVARRFLSASGRCVRCGFLSTSVWESRSWSVHLKWLAL